MSASLFGTGGIINANVSGTLVPQSFVATSGQTVFNITGFTYTTGTSSLLVWINGQKQNIGRDFLETSNTSFTLLEGCIAGDFVDILGIPFLNLSAVTAGNILLGNTYTLANYLSDIAINVKSAPYYASGSGVLDDTLIIQAALDTGKNVYLPPGNYLISAPLHFAANGQQFFGAQSTTFTALPKCTIFCNAPLSKLFNFSSATTGFSDCILSGIRFNANNFANGGIDFTGGFATYRNIIENCVVEFVNYGVNPTGVNFGDGPFPNFSNDCEIKNTYIGGCLIGVNGASSTNQMQNVTIKGVPGSINVVAKPGAYFNLISCILSGGTRHISVTSPQLINCVGCWFEDSSQEIYYSVTSHTVTFTGCYLQSSNPTKLMEFNSAAGNVNVLGCFVPITAASSLLSGFNPTYGFSTRGSNVTTTETYTERIIGSMRSDNCNFAAGLLSDRTNATGGGTTYNFNSASDPWIEQLDLENCFDAATGIFTAKYTGTMNFTIQMALNNLAAGHNDIQVVLFAGGFSYLFGPRLNVGVVRTGTNDFVFTGSKQIFMLKGQIAYIQILITGAGNTVSVLSGNTGTNWRTRFEGSYQ